MLVISGAFLEYVLLCVCVAARAATASSTVAALLMQGTPSLSACRSAQFLVAVEEVVLPRGQTTHNQVCTIHCSNKTERRNSALLSEKKSVPVVSPELFPELACPLPRYNQWINVRGHGIESGRK